MAILSEAAFIAIVSCVVAVVPTRALTAAMVFMFGVLSVVVPVLWERFDGLVVVIST